MIMNHFWQKFKKPAYGSRYRSFFQYIHIDVLLLIFLLLLCASGLLILYSSTNQNPKAMHLQFVHFGFAFGIMFVMAQIPPTTLQRTAPWVYAIGLVMLFFVLGIGHIGKGGQRWLNLGFMRFQPAEIMKLAIPLLLAWCYQKIHLPITFKTVLLAIPIIFVPAFLTAKQPDLGTAILLVIAGSSVLFLAGLSFQFMAASLSLFAVLVPFSWYFLHDYQRQRVLTFFNTERDPLGSGYHIIQSKIAIGSGGVFGKGLLNGTQSNLHFLPEP